MNIMSDAMGGMQKLPKWVFIWVNFILTPAVLLPFIWIIFDRNPIMILAAIVNVLVIIPNLVILAKQRGVSKLLSVSHLLWLPLVFYLFDSLSTLNGAIYYVTLLITIIYVISLAFDIVDSIKYFKGDHTVLRK
ncbi:MAG: hypothetical protein ACI8Y7_000788 [Candidatus Woesearchaeota archaeon]|jgi:hypothetical protein